MYVQYIAITQIVIQCINGVYLVYNNVYVVYNYVSEMYIYLCIHCLYNIYTSQLFIFLNFLNFVPILINSKSPLNRLKFRNKLLMFLFSLIYYSLVTIHICDMSNFKIELWKSFNGLWSLSIQINSKFPLKSPKI